MSGRLLKSFALAALLVFGCSWFSQPARGQTVEPYGPYGYSPGAYDYSSSPSASSWSYRSQSAQSQTVEPYGPYGYSPGAYDYSSSPSASYAYTPRAYDNSYSTYRDTPSYPYASPADRTGTMQLEQVNTPRDRTAHIRVRVPGEAKIWFNGDATSQRGEVRDFQSPALNPGKRYFYDLRATWEKDGRTVERTRHLRVRAGEQISVNLAGS